jgi:hypothetical protein
MPQPLQPSTSTFRKLIEGGFLYVDKTRFLYDLVSPSAGVYFLSRPRRFGKSLTVSTLEEIFHGSKDLFQGLWIDHSDYAWQAYPVLRFDLSLNTVKSAHELEQALDYYLEGFAQQFNLTLRGFNYQSRFANLLLQLSEEKQVVVLVDEYDKPILDNIEQLAEAKRIRSTLKSFYGVLKAMDAALRFVFITGISKFSRVGIFSDPNNLIDLTMNPAMATALGITEEELLDNFQEHLAALAAKEGVTLHEMLQQVRAWYDGFCFTEDAPNVYNPFSTVQLFYHQRFANYWFESSTPTFLIKLIKERDADIQPLQELELADLNFSTYDLEQLDLISLLFQTGYLTIKGYHREPYGGLYTLSYPNMEVKNAFLTYLLSAYNDIEVVLTASHLHALLHALYSHDLPRFFTVLDVLFANIDYDLHLNQEKYYQTIFYLIFLLLGVRVHAEVKTSRGRIDALVELPDRIYLFEFKLGGRAATALEQIKTNDYYQKYRLLGKALTLIGVRFDRRKRKVTGWKYELEE